MFAQRYLGPISFNGLHRCCIPAVCLWREEILWKSSKRKKKRRSNLDMIAYNNVARRDYSVIVKRLVCLADAPLSREHMALENQLTPHDKSVIVLPHTFFYTPPMYVFFFSPSHQLSSFFLLKQHEKICICQESFCLTDKNSYRP